MFKEKIKEITKKNENNKKRKIENIIVLIIILIVTVLAIDNIFKGDNISKLQNSTESGGKTLADSSSDGNNNSNNIEIRLADILKTIKGVGSVNVFINYSESSSTVPIYDETVTTSSTSETDSSGGIRNVTETQNQKDVIFKEYGSQKEVAVEKTIMPKVEGAIITAEGAANANTKMNIINAVEAVTGLTVDKIQVFEKN